MRWSFSVYALIPVAGFDCLSFQLDAMVWSFRPPPLKDLSEIAVHSRSAQPSPWPEFVDLFVREVAYRPEQRSQRLVTRLVQLLVRAGG